MNVLGLSTTCAAAAYLCGHHFAVCIVLRLWITFSVLIILQKNKPLIANLHDFFVQYHNLFHYFFQWSLSCRRHLFNHHIFSFFFVFYLTHFVNFLSFLHIKNLHFYHFFCNCELQLFSIVTNLRLWTLVL